MLCCLDPSHVSSLLELLLYLSFVGTQQRIFSVIDAVGRTVHLVDVLLGWAACLVDLACEFKKLIKVLGSGQGFAS